jgi:hypothetical protein
VGTKVRYSGSIESYHGEYEVTGYSDLSLRRDLPPEVIDEHWPDGIAYELWPIGVPRKFGNRHLSLHCVRRKNLSVIED